MAIFDAGVQAGIKLVKNPATMEEKNERTY
jgi:hypothetical protein